MKQKHKTIPVFFVLFLVISLSGCVMTVEQMYCIPRRSESFTDLQNVMDEAMQGMEYCAPVSGENQQPVQMEDLDGDGKEEIIVFAKAAADKPLQIMIFANIEGKYRLVSTIQSAGTSFEQVEYAQMDGRAGCEIIVGCQVHDQVTRNLSVYSIGSGEPEQILSANYGEFILADMNEDHQKDIVVLNPGRTEMDNALISVYAFYNGAMERSAELSLSNPVSRIKRIMTGCLSSGEMAVFIASNVDENTIVTDVFALKHGNLTNIAQSNEANAGVKTLRNYYVYSEDIDYDGMIELPELITMRTDQAKQKYHQEHIIRWYAMDIRGQETTKCFTYHNYLERWYMELDPEVAPLLSVVQEGDGCYRFCIWNEDKQITEDLWSLYVLTGEERSSKATQGQRFVLKKTDNVVYAAELEDAARFLGINREILTDAFHLIRSAWKTGEM